MKKVDVSKRIWEIDFLRGLSIILVIGYHLLYDLGAYVGDPEIFGVVDEPVHGRLDSGPAFLRGSLHCPFGHEQHIDPEQHAPGLEAPLVSIAVTAVTYVFDPPSAIWFGILQLLAVSILIFGVAFEKAKAITCAAWGILFLILAPVVHLLKKSVAIHFDWLLPFGIHSPAYSSFDYFPLIPWSGVFLIGAALGKSIYAPRLSLLPWQLPQTFVKAAGRHSLLIYIVHQPVILGALYVLGLMN